MCRRCVWRSRVCCIVDGTRRSSVDARSVESHGTWLRRSRAVKTPVQSLKSSDGVPSLLSCPRLHTHSGCFIPLSWACLLRVHSNTRQASRRPRYEELTKKI